MYCRYWGLKEVPFRNTPDPRFLYYTEEHEEALVRLLYVVTESRGGMLLTGDYGCGKTLLSRVFLSELNEDNLRIIVKNYLSPSSSKNIESGIPQLAVFGFVI
jgi:general secretion pathway protein A